jgi:hypothetical protein
LKADFDVGKVVSKTLTVVVLSSYGIRAIDVVGIDLTGHAVSLSK